MSLIRFTEQHTIQSGSPMPRSVYGSDRKLLLAKGVVVSNDRQRELLISQAVYCVPPAMDNGAPELPDSSNAEPLVFSAAPPVAGETDALKERWRSLSELATAYARYGDRSRLQMKISRGEGMKTYQVHVEGVLYDMRCLLLAAPSLQGISPGIEKGEVWLCRLFNTTTVFRFQGTILEADITDASHLIVELPRHIERRVVRKKPRALTSLGVRLHKPDGDPAVAIDLSTTGMRIAAMSSARLGGVGSKFAIHLDVPALDRMFKVQVEGRITSASGATDERFPDVQFFGVEFVAISDMDALVLYGYVQQHIAEEFDRLSYLLTCD